MKKILKASLTMLPILYMILIWTLSSHPDSAVVELKDDKVDNILKESLHLIEFAILYMLFAAALAAHGKLTRSFSLYAALAACLYGITDEIHQSFVPSRSSSLIDVLKDIIGVTAAYFHVRYHYFKRNRGFLTIIERVTNK
ncbi:VanZ family protein [Peribacillus sp. SCS-155]|uniref:VanZ family protein n=1 Tax=Peribacillus sedimenti TaxID=3115297 RepID=UPI003905C89B